MSDGDIFDAEGTKVEHRPRPDPRDLDFGAPGSDRRRVSMRPAAKGVAKTRQRSLGHRAASAPMWSSCAWVIKSPRRSRPIFSTKDDVGQHEIDAGKIGPRKAEAAIDHQPFARARADRSRKAPRSCRFRRGRRAARRRIRFRQSSCNAILTVREHRTRHEPKTRRPRRRRARPRPSRRPFVRSRRSSAKRPSTLPRPAPARRELAAPRPAADSSHSSRMAAKPSPPAQRSSASTKASVSGANNVRGGRRAGAGFAQRARWVRQSLRRAGAINANADDRRRTHRARVRSPVAIGDAFEENPGELGAIQQKVVRPFQREAVAPTRSTRANRVD